MLTPKYYWRRPVGFHHDAVPAEDLELPEELAKQRKPPRVGDGLILAAYCDETSTGLFRWAGAVLGEAGARLRVERRRLNERIRAQYEMRRRKWSEGAFGFDEKKFAGYGLRELWTRLFCGSRWGGAVVL